MDECVLYVVFVASWFTGMICQMMVERLERRRCERKLSRIRRKERLTDPAKRAPHRPVRER